MIQSSDTESTLLTLMTLLTSLIQLLWGKLLPAIPPLDAEGPYRKKNHGPGIVKKYQKKVNSLGRGEHSISVKALSK